MVGTKSRMVGYEVTDGGHKVTDGRIDSPTERSYGCSMPPTRAARTYNHASWRAYGPSPVDPVLGAAVEAFNEVGYDGATVRDIARRCGLSVAGIYHHYAGKQEMLFAAMSFTMDELEWRGAAAYAEGGDDPVVRFKLQVETLALSHMHWIAQVSIGSTEMRSLTPQNRAVIKRRRAELERRIEADVLAAVDSGAFAVRYPREAVRAVSVMCIATGQWYNSEGELSPEQIAHRCVDISLDAMRYTGEKEAR